MIFQKTSVRRQGFGNICCLMLLSLDDCDQETHVLFIETKNDWARLGHFGEEELRNF